MKAFRTHCFILGMLLLLTVSCASAPQQVEEKKLEQKLEEKSFKNSIGMEFVLLPAGLFRMGSPVDEPDSYHDETRHMVTISKPYYIQTTEVTQGQWKAVMGENPSFHVECGDNCPVEQVSWEDAQAFISKLNEMEGVQKYRLPTEAEWEYACRAENETAFSNGAITKIKCEVDSNLDAVGWYCANADEKTQPVASKQPNAWGLYDMHGNVWEWCQDYYTYYPTVHVKDPRGPDAGKVRVVRGGSWVSFASLCRSASRAWNGPQRRVTHLGFRVVRDQ